MKFISFVVPCYNSQDYMGKCIDSLLEGGEDVEIIIVDDGSKDKTGKIADKYAVKYPSIIKVIHQPNGGHGEGINVGLKVATGKYFKVIDSDDWVDKKALKAILKKVKKINSDLIVMNYVYTYSDGRPPHQINFKNVFKDKKEITWDEIGKFKTTQYLSLHSLMYKKSVLDKTKIKLPKHISYDDNLFIYLPFINTKTVYYLDKDFYRYSIGREDQSVQESTLIRKSSDQVLVTKLVCNAYDLDTVKSKKLKKMMYRECVFLMGVAVVFTRLKFTPEAEKEYKQLWEDVKVGNPKLYKKMRFSLAGFVSMPGIIGRFIGVYSYKFAHSLVNFN